MPQTKAILWDFGNVICFFDHLIACRSLAARSTLEFSPERIYTEVFRSGFERDFDRGAIDPPAFLDALRRGWSVMGSDEEIALAWSDIFQPNEAVRDVLGRIPDEIRLILGSNTNRLHYDLFRSQFAEVLDLFDAEVLSFAVGEVKPDPRFYRECIVLAQCAPGEILYFDDRADLIAAGTALGLDGVVYSPELDLEAILRERGILLSETRFRRPRRQFNAESA